MSSEEIKTRCEQCLAYLGEWVRVNQGNRSFRAKVLGLGLQGQLLVDDGQSLLNLSAGSILPCKI